MFNKRVLAAAALAVLAAPTFAAKVGGVDISGYVLFETWVDKHQFRDSNAPGPGSEPAVFTLHNINFSGEGALDGGLRYNWKLGHRNRNRNGDFGGSGSSGSREAWVGLEGGFGAVKLGRFLTKGWEVIVLRLGAAFERSRFRERFEAKGRLAAHLRDIPTFVIDAPESPALLGASRALDQD